MPQRSGPSLCPRRKACGRDNGNYACGKKEFRSSGVEGVQGCPLESQNKLGGKKYRMRICVLAQGIAMSPLLNSCNSLNPFFFSDKQPRLLLTRLQRILHQHSDGHGADTAWNGRNGAGFWGDLVEVDISGQTKAFFPTGIFNASCAHIEYDSALANVLFFYKTRLTPCRYENLGGRADFHDIAAAGVHDGNGRVAAWSFGHQQKGERFPH